MSVDFLRAGPYLWTLHTTDSLRALADDDWLTDEVGVALTSSAGDGVVVYANTHAELAEQFQLIADGVRVAATPHSATLTAVYRLRGALARVEHTADADTNTDEVHGLRSALAVALTRWPELVREDPADSSSAPAADGPVR